MLKFYRLFVSIFLLAFFESCCSGGDGGGGYYSQSYYSYGIHLIDTGDVIKEIRFAPLMHGQAPAVIYPNSRFAKWKISSAFDQTIMFIVTKNKTDTLIVESKNTIRYQNSICGKEATYEKSDPLIFYHTFDTAYIKESSFSANYSFYDGDTVYIKLK